jgi:hypothetical protein
VGSCKYGDEPSGSGVMDLVSYFVTFFVLGPNIFLSSLLPHTPSICVLLHDKRSSFTCTSNNSFYILSFLLIDIIDRNCMVASIPQM